MHSQIMRRSAVVLVAAVITVGALSAADVLGQLGVNPAAAKNESYESKPSEWKLCYRAGKEPVAAARVAVGAWLKELGR